MLESEHPFTLTHSFLVLSSGFFTIETIRRVLCDTHLFKDRSLNYKFLGSASNLSDLPCSESENEINLIFIDEMILTSPHEIRLTELKDRFPNTYFVFMTDRLEELLEEKMVSYPLAEHPHCFLTKPFHIREFEQFIQAYEVWARNLFASQTEDSPTVDLATEEETNHLVSSELLFETEPSSTSQPFVEEMVHSSIESSTNGSERISTQSPSTEEFLLLDDHSSQTNECLSFTQESLTTLTDLSPIPIETSSTILTDPTPTEPLVLSQTTTSTRDESVVDWLDEEFFMDFTSDDHTKSPVTPTENEPFLDFEFNLEDDFSPTSTPHEEEFVLFLDDEEETTDELAPLSTVEPLSLSSSTPNLEENTKSHHPSNPKNEYLKIDPLYNETTPSVSLETEITSSVKPKPMDSDDQDDVVVITPPKAFYPSGVDRQTQRLNKVRNRHQNQ